MNKFNQNPKMTIDRVKAHHTYLKPKKKKHNDNALVDEDAVDYKDIAPWELQNVKGLGKGSEKPKKKEEYFFDTKNDNKPLKIKKKSKVEKLSRAFIMLDGKKYHEIGGQPFE